MQIAKQAITLTPMGLSRTDILEPLAERITGNFSLPCRISPDVGPPSYAFNPHREQYLSTTILERLLVLAQPDSLRVLGICEVDLYIPILTHVFGEAQLGNRCAIISLHRLANPGAGLLCEKDLLLARAEKEAVHELGHTFNLLHCRDRGCVMFPSRSLEDIDGKTAAFCYYCKFQLAYEIRSCCPDAGEDRRD